MTEAINGKKLLVVDDEPDVLEALCELLDMCVVDRARNFETAERLIKENSYDAVILDIMGVNGYELLQLARCKDLLVLMLTAHALSPEHLVKSMAQGAFAYIPKDEMVDIAFYLEDAIQAKFNDNRKYKNWFKKLSSIFEKKFGSDWRIKHKEDLKEFDLTPTKVESEKIR